MVRGKHTCRFWPVGTRACCQAERTEALLMWGRQRLGWVGGGGDIDEDAEKIVRTRQRLVVGVCGPSQCKQTVQRAWLPIIFSLWRFDTWGEGGQAHNGAENTASISFLCRSLHLHCSVSPSFAASPFLTQCPHLNSPAASFT